MKKLAMIPALVLAACGGNTIDQREPGGTSTAGAPTSNATSGPGAPSAGSVPPGFEFTGAYDVPVPAELAAAATYATADIHWTMQDGMARLEYDLPQGLVGSLVHVEFAGPFDPQTNKGMLTGEAGTAECTVTATGVSCFERMPGILPINADMALIEQIAKQEYPGPAQHRIDVTQRFIGDPIGIVRFDLSTGVVAPADDSGKDRPKRDDD